MLSVLLLRSGQDSRPAEAAAAALKLAVLALAAEGELGTMTLLAETLRGEGSVRRGRTTQPLREPTPVLPLLLLELLAGAAAAAAAELEEEEEVEGRRRAFHQVRRSLAPSK